MQLVDVLPFPAPFYGVRRKKIVQAKKFVSSASARAEGQARCLRLGKFPQDTKKGIRCVKALPRPKPSSASARAAKQMMCLQAGKVPVDTKRGLRCMKAEPKGARRPSLKHLSPGAREAECALRPGRLINVKGGKKRCVKLVQAKRIVAKPLKLKGLPMAFAPPMAQAVALPMGFNAKAAGLPIAFAH